jgi:hypothetical protein
MARSGRSLLYGNQKTLASGAAGKPRKCLNFDSLYTGKIRTGHPSALGFSFAVSVTQYKGTMTSKL